MRRRSAWKIENYTYRECSHPEREFGYAVSLHNHSVHSVEKLAALNQVVKLGFMRPLSGILQRSFGLAGIADLNYAAYNLQPTLHTRRRLSDGVRLPPLIGASTGFT